MDQYTVPNDLTVLKDDELYDCLGRLANYRQVWGRGRNEQAQRVRGYCAAQDRRLKAELRHRNLPESRPESGRVFGPGRIEQRAHTGA